MINKLLVINSNMGCVSAKDDGNRPNQSVPQGKLTSKNTPEPDEIIESKEGQSPGLLKKRDMNEPDA